MRIVLQAEPPPVSQESPFCSREGTFLAFVGALAPPTLHTVHYRNLIVARPCMGAPGGPLEQATGRGRTFSRKTQDPPLRLPCEDPRPQPLESSYSCRYPQGGTGTVARGVASPAAGGVKRDVFLGPLRPAGPRFRFSGALPAPASHGGPSPQPAMSIGMGRAIGGIGAGMMGSAGCARGFSCFCKITFWALAPPLVTGWAPGADQSCLECHDLCHGQQCVCWVYRL